MCTIRVLSWNVHGCVGRDRVCDPHRVAEVLEAARPDIAALQEIDARVARSLSLDPFAYFADRFGWAAVPARTITTKDGHYGHILMSRWPMESLGIEDLSLPRKEPRKAIVGEVASPPGPITVIAAHLGLSPRDRRVQLERLKRRIAGAEGGPIIALGDFNDVRRRGFADRMLCPPLKPVPPLATFPSHLPFLALDRIWYSAPLEIESVATLREAHRLSDHLPLIATLRLASSRSASAALQRGVQESSG